MQFSEGGVGRAFVLRLNDGEILHEEIERFARRQGIAAASVVVVGGCRDGSVLVTGPKDGDARPIEPMTRTLEGVHEIAGTGTIFPDEDGNPVAHIHIAAGREGRSTTGCIRRGVVVWQILEVIVQEYVGMGACRVYSKELGFAALPPREQSH